MKIDPQEILDMPLTTNRIRVLVNLELFFSKYAIVSYYSQDKLYKNLAYEQLSDISFLSVCGIKTRWDGDQYYTRFFVLTEKDKQQEVLKSLRNYVQIKSRIDDLEQYNENQRQRIIALLAINSLGQDGGRKMYNNGSLLLCDDRNFLIPRNRKELVCLRIDVSEYLVLNAKTTTFSTPKNMEELRKHRHCVFQVGKDINGQWWSGLAVKPVVLKDVHEKNIGLESYFIKKKRFSDKHNIVPYWPYSPDQYKHGRLFALFQTVEAVNSKFGDIIKIEFVDNKVLYYDEYKPEKDMMTLLSDNFLGKYIFIDNPFGCRAEQFVSLVKDRLKENAKGVLFSHERTQTADMIIRLCEPKEDNSLDTHYSQSLYRLAQSTKALQHVVFNEMGDDEISRPEARRILMELFIKDCLVLRKLPKELNLLAENWEFFRYKIRENFVVGASLKMDASSSFSIEEFGFSGNQSLLDFKFFSETRLLFDDCDKIRGKRDYCALKKDGNVYLIVDTDEIPILDVGLIDEIYWEIVNDQTPLSFFKRKQEKHKYLRGYIGFHLWKTDGLYGESDSAFAYISGINSENMQIMKKTKMDRMPRVRRIFVIHKDKPQNVDADISEIVKMLKFGFGRWNEIMTYPFPFKLLLEYLDDISEVAYSKHWQEI